MKIERKVNLNNKYLYYSHYRIDIDDFDSDEKLFIHSIEHVLFKTKRHIQRSIGITKIPIQNLKSIDCFQNKSLDYILDYIDSFIFRVFSKKFHNFDIPIIK